MSVLFGHPCGNPNSHHAALAHFERGRLEAFCVPWMPTPRELGLLDMCPGLHGLVKRLARRSFAPLLPAPRIEGKCGEWWRMAQRVALSGASEERLANEANQWLMQTLCTHLQRPAVKAVHSYEDCSLAAFEAAKRQGKLCIYDMPIGYYAAWERTRDELNVRFADWIGESPESANRYVLPEQKRREMELADLVLAPSEIVANTFRGEFDKRVAIARYGVDCEFWTPDPEHHRQRDTLRVVYAGHISVRKGTPLLLEAWQRAALPNAELELIGLWRLAPSRQQSLPAGVRYVGHCSPEGLREKFRHADLFVFPSFFEGFALVVYEAMACGLPVLLSDMTPAGELLDASSGRTFPSGDVDALIEALRHFSDHRDDLARMRGVARSVAESLTWTGYRTAVNQAVDSLLGTA